MRPAGSVRADGVERFGVLRLDAEAALRGAPVASIMASIPATISAGKCFISSASLWISGSHSAPLAIMNSTSGCGLDVGGEARPAGADHAALPQFLAEHGNFIIGGRGRDNVAVAALPFREFRVPSWDEFLKLITSAPYSNWAFRGERHARWPLDTSLSRYFRDFGVHPRGLARAGGAHPAHLQAQGAPVPATAAGSQMTISSGWR